MRERKALTSTKNSISHISKPLQYHVQALKQVIILPPHLYLLGQSMLPLKCYHPIQGAGHIQTSTFSPTCKKNKQYQIVQVCTCVDVPDLDYDNK